MMNKTCLLSDALKNLQDDNLLLQTEGNGKRGKSLNKTGLVVLNENENIVDFNNDDEEPDHQNALPAALGNFFFNNKK